MRVAKPQFLKLNENGLLYSFQSGFRKRFSTETALIRLVDQVLFDLDNDKVTGLVFVDYKKAFDLIDHHLLLTKLGAIGIGEDYLPLFTDYMNGRKQYVNIDGCHSSIRDITLGVPQGSILGPVLFLIFINDLPSALQDTVADIYADDTTVSYSTDYRLAPQAVSDSLQSDLNKLQKWSDNNKMILNEKKTKTMLATGKWLEKRMGHQQLQVKLNATELDQVNSQKLLGVTIDSKLSFDEHINDLCRKVSQRIAVLKRIKKFLPFQQRIAYYNAMIKQDMLHASVVWSSCSLGNLQRILTVESE